MTSVFKPGDLLPPSAVEVSEESWLEGRISKITIYQGHRHDSCSKRDDVRGLLDRRQEGLFETPCSKRPADRRQQPVLGYFPLGAIVLAGFSLERKAVPGRVLDLLCETYGPECLGRKPEQEPVTVDPGDLQEDPSALGGATRSRLAPASASPLPQV